MAEHICVPDYQNGCCSICGGLAGVATCPFCAIIDDGAPAKHLMPPQEDIIVIEPLNPVTEGHALVIPKVHVTDFAHHPETSGMTMKWAAWYARSVGDANIITSIGLAATQTVRHLHVHVVPRQLGDGLMLPWSGKSIKSDDMEKNSADALNLDCSWCGHPKVSHMDPHAPDDETKRSCIISGCPCWKYRPRFDKPAQHFCASCGEQILDARIHTEDPVCCLNCEPPPLSRKDTD
jgi:histidine triad (HIT) family protein